MMFSIWLNVPLFIAEPWNAKRKKHIIVLISCWSKHNECLFRTAFSAQIERWLFALEIKCEKIMLYSMPLRFGVKYGLSDIVLILKTTQFRRNKLQHSVRKMSGQQLYKMQYIKCTTSITVKRNLLFNDFKIMCISNCACLKTND